MELDEADEYGDVAGSAGLHAERDALIAQLAAAYGLGGRPRRSGRLCRTARTAVTARIRDAIRRIEDLHPQLGRHLSRSVRTGTFCIYDRSSRRLGELILNPASGRPTVRKPPLEGHNLVGCRA